nr:hypothetical protein [Candidatus Palauibacterales bacterium]
SCLESSHVEFTFGGDTTGVSDHGNLSGLTDDDHSQYLLTDGVRNATDGFAVTGETGVGTIPVTGQGVRLMWYPGKAAFRAGKASGSEWDDANVGRNSVAFGTKVTASGLHSVALGLNNRATGSSSLAVGAAADADGDVAMALGNGVLASGGASLATGLLTRAAGQYSTAMGQWAQADHDGAFVWADASSSNGFASTGPNQFLVRAVGGVGLGTNSPYTQLDVERQVSGSAADTGNHVANFENTATSGGDVLMLNSDASQPGSAVNYITFGSAAGNIGAIEGNGSGGVTLTSGSGDFAELLPRARESESIEAGDVVGVFGGEITKRTAGAEQVMVVTDRAMILGNDPGPEARKGYEKVAFVGQVPVTVRGPVEKGDLLVASGRDDGTARALAPSDYSPVADGPIIGKAWEASSGGTQRVNALVGTAGETAALRSVVQRQEERIQRLQRNDERLERRIQKLETAVEELMESARTEQPGN